MNKKRIAIASAAAAIAIGAGIGVATFASFSSQRDVAGTATSGTLILNDSMGASWTLPGTWAPDDSHVETKTFLLRNDGNLPGSTLTLTLDAYGTVCVAPNTNCVTEDVLNVPEEGPAEGGFDTNSELPEKLQAQISYIPVGGTGSVYLTNSGNVGFVNLGGTTADRQFTITPSVNLVQNPGITVTVELRLPSTAGNEVQGDKAQMKLTAELKQ